MRHTLRRQPSGPSGLPRRFGRGSLLVFTMIFGLLLSLTMVPALSFITQTTRMAYGTKGSDDAFYAAEGGVAKALSHIYNVGNGAVTGIRDSRFNVSKSDAHYPFGEEWLSNEDGAEDDASATVGVKIRMWREAATGSWIIQSIGRSLLPKENFRTVEVRIQAAPFSRYAFFNSDSLSAIDGLPRWLAPGETFNGPVHTNRHLFVYGTTANPLTFNSDVTIVGEEVKQASPNNKVIYNGLKDTNAAYVELPNDMSDLMNAAADGGLDLPGDWPASKPKTGFVDPTPGVNNFGFVFKSDGTVDVTDLDFERWKSLQSGQTAATAHAAATFNVSISSTNGAFIVRDGNVRVSGTVSGRVTLAALSSDSNQSLIAPYTGGRRDGNVIVDGTLVYKTHPLYNGSYDTRDTREFDPDVVTDVLGLVAERNFLLDGSAPSNCIIDAHILVSGQASPNPDVRTWPTTTNTSTVINGAINQDGAFYVEDGVQRDLSELWMGLPDGESGNGTATGSGYKGTSNNIYLTGGVVHFVRGQTSNGTGGYNRKYSFDTRLLTNPPPFYPMTPDLQIVGWKDVASTANPEG